MNYFKDVLVWIYYFLIALLIFDFLVSFWVLVLIKSRRTLNGPYIGLKEKLNDFKKYYYHERLVYIGATIIITVIVKYIQAL